MSEHEHERDLSGGAPQPQMPQPGAQGGPWQQQPVPQQPAQPQPAQLAQPQFDAPQAAPFGAPGVQPPSGFADPHPGWGPGGPAGPSGPVGPQPPKRGLPVGAWIGIAAGALVLLGAIVFTFVFVIGAAGAAFSSTTQERPTTTQPAPPLDDDDADDDADDIELGASGTLLIDGVADFAVGPYWEVGFNSEWQIDVFDVGGENRFTHPATGCQFFSYQGFGGFASASDGDQIASEKVLENAVRGGLGLEWQATGSPNIVFDRTVMLEAYGYDGVEMLRYVSDYVHADGSNRQRVFLIRNFQPSDAVLYAMTDCPVAATNVGSDLMETLRVNDAF